MTEDKIAWADRRTILRLFSIPQRKLDGLYGIGAIRSAKFGNKQQSARVYRVADVDAALTALAEGREPRRPPVRVGKGRRR